MLPSRQPTHKLPRLGAATYVAAPRALRHIPPGRLILPLGGAALHAAHFAHLHGRFSHHSNKVLVRGLPITAARCNTTLAHTACSYSSSLTLCLHDMSCYSVATRTGLSARPQGHSTRAGLHRHPPKAYLCLYTHLIHSSGYHSRELSLAPAAGHATDAEGAGSRMLRSD